MKPRPKSQIIDRDKKWIHYEKIQEKIFTRWINFYLERASMKVENLFVDMADHRILSKLIEILSGEKLFLSNDGCNDKKNKENIHRILSFLRTKKKALDIYAADIINGNHQSILKMIWEIIYYFEIQSLIFKHEIDDESNGNAPEQHLLTWCQRITKRYFCVHIHNFTVSWSSGLAFNAIIHANRPDLFNFNKLLSYNDTENLKHAFEIAYSEIGIPQFLDPEDVDYWTIEEKCIILYIGFIYRALVQKTDLEFVSMFKQEQKQDENEKLCVKDTSIEKLNSNRKQSNLNDDVKNYEEIKENNQNEPNKENIDIQPNDLNMKNDYSNEKETKKNDSNFKNNMSRKNVKSNKNRINKNKNEEEKSIKYIKNDYNITINKSSDSVTQNSSNDLRSLFPLLTGTIISIFIGVLLIRIIKLD